MPLRPQLQRRGSSLEIFDFIRSYAMAYEFAYLEGGAVIGPLPTLPPSAAWSKLGMRQQDRLNNGEDSGTLKAAYYKCNICFGPVNKNDRPPQRKCDCIRDGRETGTAFRSLFQPPCIGPEDAIWIPYNFQCGWKKWTFQRREGNLEMP